MEEIRVQYKTLEQFCLDVLLASGVQKDIAFYVAEGLSQTSLRGIDSHGVRLLPHYIRALKAGRINGNPKLKFIQDYPAVACLDADHTFGHAAGAIAMKKAIEIAIDNGIGSTSVYKSTHFGAAGYFSLMAAEEDMIGLSFTHADSLMLTYSGTRPFFGTNPIAFSAPVKDEEPFCLDMATSMVNWNKIKEYLNDGEKLEMGWAVDKNANETNDPKNAKALLPIGAYKGFGLSMMIEILCALLTGMPYGRDITSMYTDPIEKKRNLGHFFIAINIASFTDLNNFKIRMKSLMDDVRHEPAKNKDEPVLVAGDPEKIAKKGRLANGIPIPKSLWEEFNTLSEDTKVILLKVI